MSADDPKIPYGYKRVPVGEQTRYRDGAWNGMEFVRLRKSDAFWPVVGESDFVIRRCEVAQQEFPECN